MDDTTTPQNISDTARWVAWYRALESERPDAWFHDPLARRLAGKRGERIAEGMSFANRNAWSFVARTVLIDRFIAEKVQQGVEVIIEQDHHPVAVIKASQPAGRKISEVIAALEASGANAVLDEDFARDVKESIQTYREPWNPPSVD